MKLSLSARVAESFSNKEEASLNLAQLINLARNHGYRALCMRASQSGIHSPPEQVSRMSRHDPGGRPPGLHGHRRLRRAPQRRTGSVRTAQHRALPGPGETFGADLIRICMKKEEDIPWAQRASDTAAERGIRLAHQSHCSSLFETVEGLPPSPGEGGPAQLRDHLRTPPTG